VSARRDTQRIVHLNIELLDIRLLFVGFFTDLFGNELVELFLDKARDGFLDAFFNLGLNLTRVINQYFEHFGQTLLTLFCDVPQHLSV